MARGLALGTVLMIVALGLIVAFTLAATSVFHVHMSAHEAADAAAVNLAETAVSAVCDQVVANPQYGYSGPSGVPGTSQTFYPPTPWRSPTDVCVVVWSTTSPLGCVNNNPPIGDVTGTPETVGGSPTYLTGALPVGDVLVRAQATVGGVTRTAQAVIAFPRNPYSIAAQGQVTTSGTTIISGALPGQSASAAIAAAQALIGNPTMPLTMVGPGNVAANAAQSPSLVLNSGTIVTGDASAVNGISQGPGVRVRQLLPDQAPVPVPTLTAGALDPRKSGSLDAIPAYAVTPFVVQTVSAPGVPLAGSTPNALPSESGAYVLMDWNQSTQSYCSCIANLTGAVAPTASPTWQCACVAALMNLQNPTSSGTPGGTLYPPPSPLQPGQVYLGGSIVYVPHVNPTDPMPTLTATGLNGVGIIAVQGNLVLTGQSTFQAQDQLCIVTDGNLAITGQTNAANSVFFGQVYCNGNLTANNVTLAGSYNGCGPSGAPGGTTVSTGPSNMNLSNVATVGGISTSSQPLTFTVLTPPPPPPPVTTTTGGTTSTTTRSVPVQVKCVNGTLEVICNVSGKPTGVTYPACTFPSIHCKVSSSPIPCGGGHKCYLCISMPGTTTTTTSGGGTTTTTTGGGTTSTTSGGGYTRTGIMFDPNKFVSQANSVQLLYWSHSNTQ
jgi:hypothetical protein